MQHERQFCRVWIRLSLRLEKGFAVMSLVTVNCGEQRNSGQANELRSFADSFDPTMCRIHSRIAKIAKLPPIMNVLIRGETGVGKEVLAKKLHQMSERAHANFIVVNCAAIPEGISESELFGHVKGAFTGATSNKIGAFGQAHGGTIFLDEIGDLPLHLQGKLLRVLQEQEITRVGEYKPTKINVRIIAATHVNLEQAIRNGTFRQDLYYRLSGATISVPPLRSRPVDIPVLSQHVLDEFQNAAGGNLVFRLAPETMACLQAYDFPGNVRELRHALSAAIVESDDEWILPEHLPEKMRIISKKPGPKLHDAATLKRIVEGERIRWALEQTAGNQTWAAKLVGMKLRTFVSRLERHGIRRPKKSREAA